MCTKKKIFILEWMVEFQICYRCSYSWKLMQIFMHMKQDRFGKFFENLDPKTKGGV